MGHDGVASGYQTPTSFPRLTGCQRDPRDRGVPITITNNLLMGKAIKILWTLKKIIRLWKVIIHRRK